MVMDYPGNMPESHFEYVAQQDQHAIAVLVKQQAFQAMRELEGWCAESKAAILIDLILASKPDIVVEIGVFGGKSLVPMAYALKNNGHGKAFGIDPWSSQESIQGMDEANKTWWHKLDHQAILNGLIAKINKFNLQNQITLIKATSKDAPAINDIDFLHIDGNHSEETSYFDVTKWVPLVKKGGIIVLDDVTWVINGKQSQSKSLKYLDEHCTKQGQYSDGCDWAIWIKN